MNRAFDGSIDPLKPSDFPDGFMKTPGQLAYEGYSDQAGGVSIHNGSATFPGWPDVRSVTKECWEAAARNANKVPGVYKCPKCGFIQVCKLISATAVGMDTTVADRACPNDGQLMVPMTWQEQSEGLERVAAEYLTRIQGANIALSSLHNCISELANASLETVKRMQNSGMPISEETQSAMKQMTAILAQKPPQV